MATAEHLLTVKGGSVASLGSAATVLDAAQLMNDRHIGSESRPIRFLPPRVSECLLINVGFKMVRTGCDVCSL